MRAAWVLALVLALPGAAFAQAPGQTPLAGGPVQQQPPPPQNPAQARAEKVKQQVRAMRAYELTDDLALDQTTAGKMFAVMKKFDDEFDRLLAQRADIQRKLGNADKLGDGELQHVIDDAIANQRALWDVEAHRLGELRKVLSPQQTAKLLVVLPPLERKIQNQLQRAIHNAGAGAGNGGNKRKPARPRDDDDDDLDGRL